MRYRWAEIRYKEETEQGSRRQRMIQKDREGTRGRDGVVEPQGPTVAGQKVEYPTVSRPRSGLVPVLLSPAL